jgi:hypothetical protein
VYVVVIFAEARDLGDCPLSHCPMESFGPFPTSVDARWLMERLPSWQEPHVLRLSAPERAITETFEPGG